MIVGDWALRTTCVALGLWGLMSASQWWADRKAWYEGSALGWDLLGPRRRRRFAVSTVAARCFGDRSFRWLILLQLAAATLLIALPLSVLTPLWIAWLWLVSVLLVLRAHADGADKMALVVMAGALFQAIGYAAHWASFATAGALWIAGQLTIAYATSGASKLALSSWRDGKALAAAMSSYTHGHRYAALVARRPASSHVLAWLLMLSELLFPIALFAGPDVLVMVLAGFFLFHCATAVFMGLNTYPWAFLAAYPSTVAISVAIRSAVAG